LKISITLALLIFLFSKTDFKSLSSVFRSADAGDLFIAFSVFLFLYFLGLLRWRLLLNAYQVRVSFGRLSSCYFASQFFNLVLPSTIGGDAVRTMDIASHTNTPSSAVLATVLLDRVAGFFGLMTVLAVSLSLGYRILNDTSILLATAILLAFILFLSGVIFSKRFFNGIFKFLPFMRLKEYLYKMHDVAASFRGKKGVLAGVWILSIFIQAGLPVVYFFMARAIAAPLEPIYFLIFVPVITSISVIPISIAGLGVRDTASVVIFAKAGLAAEKAFALSLMNFGFMFVIGVLGGVVYVLSLHRRRV
jgi:hypothetical protein